MKKAVICILILSVLALSLALAACNDTKVFQVEVDSLPTKANYYVGEALDVSGCTLNVVYTNGDVKRVTVTADMVSALDTSSIGPKTVIVTYDEKGVHYTTAMTLHVVSRPASALSILTPPAKTRYVDGEALDLTGLTVEAYYTEEQRVVAEARELSYTVKTATLGMTAVRVGFANLTVDVPIEVVPVAIERLEARPVEGVYRNQTLSVAMFDVDFVYNNGQRDSVANATLAEAGTVLAKVGATTVHFAATHPTAGAFECALDIDVAEDTPLSVHLYSAPLSYRVGDAFRWHDVVLTVDFAHSSAVRYNLGTDTYAGFAASVADGTAFAEAGAVSITVASGDVSCSFRVGVGTDIPVRWHATEGEGDVVSCAVGDTPTPRTLVLYAVMSDGTERLVWNRWKAASGVAVTMPQPAQEGQTSAYLEYDGLRYSYNVVVR